MFGYKFRKFQVIHFFINNNNNSFYFHEVIEPTLLTQFTCNKAFLCFLSKLMLSFNFLWRNGIAEFLYLSVLALFTWYTSLFLKILSDSFLFFGNKLDNFSWLRHFFTNLKDNLSLLAYKLSIFRILRDFS